MPLVVPPAPTAGSLHFAWVDPAGVTRDLTGSASVFVEPGITGLGSAGATIADQKLPTAPGSYVLQVSTPPKHIELPLTIMAADEGALLEVIDDLRAWFDTGDETRRTPGYLRVTRPDGTVRQIACYYAGGLEGDYGQGSVEWTRYVVSLYAPDPWATATAETVTTWLAADLGVPVAQINEGQLAAYPRWKVTGPTVNVSILNNTTGTPLSVVRTLTAGQYITIDTRPPNQRVDLPILDNTGASLLPFPGSILFGNWMVPGLNSFSITLSGTSGVTSVELRYLPRYRGLLR